MATSTNPCGISLNDTLDAIKNVVMTGTFSKGSNGRTEIMKALQNSPNNFSYKEAEQITDYYYSVYNRVASSQKNNKPSIILTGSQKKEKELKNLAVSYLRGDTAGFAMSDEDVKHLEKIYENVDKADTPTLKTRYEEEAKAFIAKFLPGYKQDLFKTFVYSNPLASLFFFFKSVTSNAWAQVENSIANSFFDGKRVDFTKLFKFSGLADISFFNVLKGGVPATNLYHNESNQPTGSRLEEKPLKGTPAEGNKYYAAISFLSRWSSRFNSAPDTRGIFSNAERHLYQLYKEKLRDAGMDAKEAQQEALKQMDLMDIDAAIKMAEAKFEELGIDAGKHSTDKNGNPSLKERTSEFKVAVAEYQRIKRDNVLWQKALALSKNDFWKRNMMVKSELGFGDTGIFGYKARGFAFLRGMVEGKTDTKFKSVFNLSSFGFINGAANFAEDAIERIPLYALVKYVALSKTKSSATDLELIRDIERRQRGIVVKTITTGMFFLVARMIEQALCKKSASGNVPSGELAAGYKQIGVCGIPALVPPQMMVAHKLYQVLTNSINDKTTLTETLGNMLPIVVQANNVGLSGAIDDIFKWASKKTAAIEKRDDIGVDEANIKISKAVVDAGIQLGSSYLPIPSRLAKESALLVQKFRGVTSGQQVIPFDIDKKGKPESYWNSMANIGIYSLGNVTGISEIIIAAKGSNKNYAMDWQGRKVAQLRGSDIAGNGIQYNEYDDILRQAGVRTPYVSRLEKVEVDTEKTRGKTYYGKKSEEKNTEVRYLTDDEFFKVSDALSKFNKAHFEENYESLKREVKENRSKTADEIQKVFKASKDKAIEAVEKGKETSEEILAYVNKNWRTKGKVSSTKKSFNN